MASPYESKGKPHFPDIESAYNAGHNDATVLENSWWVEKYRKEGKQIPVKGVDVSESCSIGDDGSGECESCQ